MRKIYTVLLLVCFVLAANAQVSNYAFTSSAGTYTPIAGGVVLKTGNFSNVISAAIPISSFNFSGTNYTSLYISSNGFITFGATVPLAGNSTPLSSTATYSGAVSAFGSSLGSTAATVDPGTSPELRYETVGNEFVVQWTDTKRANIAGERISFQIRLNTATNEIKMVYGGVIVPGANNNLLQIGLRGTTNTFPADVNNVSITATTGNWLNAVVGTSNTSACYFNSATPATVPSAGLTYTWTPAAITCNAAANAVITGPASICSGVPFTLYATGSDNAASVTHRWQTSTDGGTTWVNTNNTSRTFYSTAQTVATKYRLADTCTLSVPATASLSNEFLVSMNAATYAPVPFYEGFENPWISSCGTSDIPSNSWRNTPVTSDSSWRRQDDAPTGGNTAAWVSPTSGLYTPVASVGNYSARFHSGYVPAPKRGMLDLYVDCSTGSPNKRISYDYINMGGFDSLRVYVSTNGGASFAPIGKINTVSTIWTNKFANFTSTSATTILRFVGYGDYGSTDIGIDEVKVFSLPDCIGTPDQPIASGPGSMCDGIVFTITGSANTTDAGIIHRWQLSTDGGATWVNTTGTDPDGYTTTQSVTTSYRLVDTCINSGGVAISNTVVVSTTAIQYAILPYVQSFDNWMDACSTRDVPDNNWRSTPFTGNNAFRRDDDGVAGGWTNLTTGAYTNAGAAGTAHSARIHSSNFTSPAGQFDLYVDCSSGVSGKQLSFYYINMDGNDSLRVQLSTDGGTTFQSIGNKLTTTLYGWSLITIPFTSTSPATIIRFKTYGYSTGTIGSDIGIDEVQVYERVSCSGMPTSAAISANTTSVVCSSATIVLTAIGANTSDIGITHRWQSSIDGGATWVNTTGTDPFLFTVTNQMVNTSYRLVDTCINSGDIAISNQVDITVTTVEYATLPYSQGFEPAWMDGCSTRDLPSNNWRSNPSTGNASFRREDDGGAAAWGSATNGAYSPSGANNSNHSARFHSASSGPNAGTIDLYLNCSTGLATRQLDFYYINVSGNDSMRVQLSTDNGNTFTSIGNKLTTTSGWTAISIPFTSSSATTILRFKAMGVLGGALSDIGIDEINVTTLNHCNGTPATLVITGPASACPSTSITLTGSGFSTDESGLSYRWQKSTDWGATWVNTTGTDPASFTTTQTVTTTYRLADTCSFSGMGNVSDTMTVITGAPSYAVLPFFESFDNAWIDFCSTRDIPTNSWRNTPASGNNSFRRDDDGIAAGWGTMNGSYTPAGANGSRQSARIHTYGTVSSGTLDAYIDASTGIADKQLSFYYINTSGDDSLRVMLSTDGGLTYQLIGNRLTTTTDWSAITIPFTSASATTIIRFKAYGDAGATDMGIDEVNIQEQDPMPVTLMNFNGIRKANGTVDLTWNTVTETNNKGFELMKSADGINFSSIAFVNSKANSGNSNSLLIYTYTDTHAFSSNNYYRLRQIDKDGKSSLSDVVFIKGSKVDRLELSRIYPNPVINQLNFVISSPKTDKIDIVVTDAAGKVIIKESRQVTIGDNTMSMNVQILQAGSYIIKAICAEGCETSLKKFIKQ